MKLFIFVRTGGPELFIFERIGVTRYYGIV